MPQGGNNCTPESYGRITSITHMVRSKKAKLASVANKRSV